MIDLIKSQVLTEKSNKLIQYNTYTFNVGRKLSKQNIKNIFEETFKVKVVSVNTAILPGKRRRLGKFQGFKNFYKRAFIKLMSLVIFLFLNY
uniref:ribosomal protein L23 n=1 Tax=Colacium mucronatum TaxID=167756 RepID=UPI0023AAE121|nr:ribosomal protein L23 [Colacium mucronatum]WCH63241.1 ribosomal protein L23 [Colacium mucronatum]